MFLAWACGLLSGCTMLETAAPSTSQSTPLSWLTNWVSQPMEMVPGFDVESIKPAPGPATIAPDNLLEITVWDLYEPGQPYSFPVRVSARQTVEIPFLGEVPVAGRTIPQIEALLAGSFREGDYLLNPRVLVRSLDSSLLKVQVTGAVNRSGFVELTRADPSVYAAIVSAGGLKKTSGTQVAVTRRAAAVTETATPPLIDRSDGPAGTVAGDSPGTTTPEEPRAPAGQANSLDELSVSPAAPVVRPSTPGPAGGPGGFFAVSDEPAGNSAPASILPASRPSPYRAGSSHDASPIARGPVDAVRRPDESTVWYDASLAPDREQLKLLRLEEGDLVTVKVSAPPLRIGGVVHRPGAYPLPPGRSFNVWQAIELAGGVRDGSIPLNITLVRPANEGRSAQRSYLHVAAYEDHPSDAPRVESGDVLHVEPTTGSKIKRAVGDFWNKP